MNAATAIANDTRPISVPEKWRALNLPTPSRPVQCHTIIEIPTNTNAANSEVLARPASSPVNIRANPAKPDTSGTPPTGVKLERGASVSRLGTLKRRIQTVP